jgi:hypothetical protein
MAPCSRILSNFTSSVVKGGSKSELKSRSLPEHIVTIVVSVGGEAAIWFVHNAQLLRRKT